MTDPYTNVGVSFCFVKTYVFIYEYAITYIALNEKNFTLRFK